MQVNKAGIGDFISEKRTFVIPVYQRNYSWKEKQCTRLFDDVKYLAEFGGEHFIGTFVYQYMLREIVRQLYATDKDIFRRATQLENVRKTLFPDAPTDFEIDDGFYMDTGFSLNEIKLDSVIMVRVDNL